MILRSGSICAAIAFALLAGAPARAEDTSIVAGKRVGPVAIGMKRAQVEKLLGRAASDRTLSPHRVDALWSLKDEGGHASGLLHVQFVDDAVARVGTGAKGYGTADGLAAGAPLASVEALHPDAVKTDYAVRRAGGIAAQCRDDVGAGIGFEYDRPAGRRDFVLRAIYVHAPGKPTPCGRDDDPHATKRVGAGTP